MAKAQGSNELNLLLKSKVVKIKVELDIKGSGLAGQVNNITAFLKDKKVKLKVELQTTGLNTQIQKINASLKDKNVKIGVKLDYNKSNINSQIKAINTLIKGDSGLSNIKVAVNIDVKGSASKIKTQLAEVNKDILEFNKNYKKLLDDTNKISNGVGKSKSSAVATASQNSYAKSLLDAKQFMSQQYGKGLFTSTEMKDANGVLTGFVGNLTKANGVVQKIRYDWDAKSSSFTPINRQTVTNTEKNVAKAVQSLKQLDKEISSLGKNQDKFWQESQALKNSGSKGTLTQDAVNSLKERIKEEKTLQSQIKTENNLLRQQKELIAEINRAQKSTKSSTFKNDLGDIKNKANIVNLDDSLAKNQLNDLKSSLTSLKQSYADNINKEKQLKTATERRKEVLAEIARLEKSKNISSGAGATSKRYIDETKELTKNIKTIEQYNKVRERMNATNREFKSVKIDNDIEKQVNKLKTAMRTFATTTGMSLDTIDTRFLQVSQSVRGNLQSMTNEVARYNRLTENFRTKQALEQKQNSIVPNADHTKVNNLVNAKDNNALKEYIANLNGAKVAMMRLTTDANGLSRITAQFASTKKTAKEVTYEISNVDKQLRQLSTAEVFNSNRNLGVFEQLKIAMARVPIWMVAMTAFHGSIRTVKNMTEEIFKLDKAMTELRRVADSQIDIGYMFEGALKLSKDLGNNIHDIMASVSDLARTFGHFNERQLLAIANTATLMSNVSDLTAQEATESLVGTMNAFNITAEDSIKIVDSMNEVDNNYAISTKQLATGLAKSASTSKTFGVSLEENLGHITAIGAVTMESGNIIGNSLKTIYSRITTMAGVEDVFDGIGISIRDMATGDMKDVSSILDELSLQWHDLSKAERQNIGVKVAGRYQLSRFLALMNNYSMSTEATTTALHSQGSATRENAQYLKSFEARINALKTSFTELSNSIGEAFLSSGLSVGISLLTTMAGGMTGLVDKIGVLGAMFGVLGLALFKFGALKYVWAFAIASATGLFSVVARTASGFLLLGRTAMQSLSAVRTGAITATVAIRTMGTAFTVAFGFLKSAMLSTGVLAGFVFLGWAIEKVVGHFNKMRVESEEVRKTNEKLIKSYRDSGDGMQGMLSRYEELFSKKERNIKLTQEEATELDRLTADFADKLPTIVDYYDANGVAVLKNTDAIREQIKAVSDLSREEAKLKDLELSKNIAKQAKSYGEATKEIEKVEEKIKRLKAQEDVSKDSVGMLPVDNTVEIQKQTVKLMTLEAERRAEMSLTTKLIQEQSMAHLEASGKMTGFGDSQQRLIEKFVTYNDKILMTASNNGTLEETMITMTERADSLSAIFVTAYDRMSPNLDMTQLEELRTQLEAVSASVPEDFLVIDESRPVESMKKITDGMKEIINVSVHVQQGSEDFEYLSQRLQSSGLSADQAREQLGRLADEYSNSAIRAEAMSQSVDGTATSIDSLSDSAIEAVNPLEALFGYKMDDVSAIKSHIELMEVFYDKYGEGAEKTVEFGESLYELSKFFNVGEEEIKKNLHQYNQLADALAKVKVTTDDAGSSLIDLSDLSPESAKIVDAWLNSGDNLDIFTGKLAENGGRVADIAEEYDKSRAKLAEPYPIGVDMTAIDKFVTPITDFMTYNKDMRKELGASADLINSTVSQLGQSTSSIATLNGGITDTGVVLDETKGKTQEFAKESNRALADLADTATSKSTTVTNQFESIGAKALEVSGNIRSMNTNLANASVAIQGYKTSVGGLGSLSIPRSSGGMETQSLKTSYNGVSDSISNSMASFSATAEGVSTSGTGGGEGSSGIMQQSLPTFSALHGTTSNLRIGKATSSSSSSSSSVDKAVTKAVSKSEPKTKTTKSAKEKAEKAEELAELYVIDLLERKRTKYQATLGQLEAKLSGMAENTKGYRSGLAEIMRYEEAIQRINIENLANTEKRNKTIMKQLGLLANTSKHTKEQRDEYNKLQQEYDSNLSEISQLKGEIESTIVELRKKAEEVFLDFVEEIISKIDEGLTAIKDRIDDTDFELEVLELTDPDNDIAKVDLLAKKVRDMAKEQRDYVLAQAELGGKIREATAKYGAQSDSVKLLVSDMKAYKESWEDVTLSILKAEKEIRDLRGNISDKLIEASKKHYENVQKNAEKTSKVEIDNAKKAHDAKMKLYDKESDRISELYDQRIKAIDDEYNKETYEEDVAEKNKEISKLTEKAELYSGNTSLEGKKKYSELNEEITEKQKELDSFIKKNRIDLLKEQLGEEKDMLLKKVETQKELDEEAHETFISQLEAESEAVSEHYESVTNDEKKWAKIREELMKGNFTVVKQLLSDMGIDLEQLADGTFNTLSEGFSGYSQEVRDFVLEINSMINQINSMTNSAYGSTSNISPSQGVSMSEPIRNSSITPLIQKAYAGEDLMSSTSDKDQLYNMIQGSGISEYRMNEIWRKAQAGITLDVPSPEHMQFYDMFEDILKTNKLKKFDTGGYTGNNVPSSGGLAILDNKELVLDQKQTSHILDAVKLLDKVQSILPNISRSSMEDKFATASGFTNNNNYNLTVNIDNLNGDKSGATTVVKEIMKGLKKLGR